MIPMTLMSFIVSQRIIDRHKGNIGVVSKENAGSTFYFELPAWHCASDTVSGDVKSVSLMSESHIRNSPESNDRHSITSDFNSFTVISASDKSSSFESNEEFKKTPLPSA